MIKSAGIAAGAWLGSFAADFLLWLVAVLFFSVPPVLSQVLSYLIAALNRFFLLRWFRYPESSGAVVRFFRFLALSVSVTVLSSGGLILLCFGAALPVAQAKLWITAATALINQKINAFIFGKTRA